MHQENKSSWIKILWPTVENGYEQEYIPIRNAISAPNIFTLAQCTPKDGNHVYRYPAKAKWTNNILDLTYKETPQEWEEELGWKIEAGRTEIIFPTKGSLIPQEVIWHRKGKYLSRALKQNQDWYFFAEANEEIQSVIENISIFEDAPSHDVAEMFLSIEGKKILRKHFSRERSPQLVKEFKAQLWDHSCEICEFSFSDLYGPRGAHYIEAHHKTPLGSLDDSQTTTIGDLIAVCSNCHRMLHRTDPPISAEELRAIVKSNKNE